MKEQKKCKQCKTFFITYKHGLYCSNICYLNSRWGQDKCKNCGKEAKVRYCSDGCRNDFWLKNEYALLKKNRYWKRKEELIEKLGGKCRNCGISDIRVLDINHTDRTKKTKIKTYNWTKRLGQWEKDLKILELLCANCHRIFTWEQMNYGKDKPVIKRPLNTAK